MKALVEQECWTVDDLKGMADTTSNIYAIGVSHGIPEGMARAFKEELREFKPAYRESHLLIGLSTGSAS